MLRQYRYSRTNIFFEFRTFNYSFTNVPSDDKVPSESDLFSSFVSPYHIRLLYSITLLDHTQHRNCCCLSIVHQLWFALNYSTLWKVQKIEFMYQWVIHKKSSLKCSSIFYCTCSTLSRYGATENQLVISNLYKLLYNAAPLKVTTEGLNSKITQFISLGCFYT